MQTSLRDIIDYLKSLRGKIILTIEENSVLQWLYTELTPHVEKLIICDPYRNHLLKEGPKNDDIDAIKLVKLLRADLLKEVFHSASDFIQIRKITSSYVDLIRLIVRLKNQRSAVLRAKGIKKDSREVLDDLADQFVVTSIDNQLDLMESERAGYLLKFRELKSKHKDILNISKIPGIGDILAIRIVSRIVDSNRFKSKGQFLSYCGLVKHDLSSGGKVYGSKNTRYSREMKYCFKTAVMAAIRSENEFHDYYRHLIEAKRSPDHVARHATYRRIATVTWGVLKSKKQYQVNLAREWRRYPNIRKTTK